jgi:hypothetical protein
MNRIGHLASGAMDDAPSEWHSTGIERGDPEYDCIWSGDLPALLAAMVAENEGLRNPTPEAIRAGVMALTMPWDSVIPPTANADEYIMGMAWQEIVRTALQKDAPND